MNTQAAPDWQSEIESHRATFLSYLLLFATVGGLIAMTLTYVTLPEGMSTSERWIETAPFLAGWLVVLITWLWRGMGYNTRSLIVLLLTYLLGLFIFRRGGLPGSGRVWLLVLPALTFILAGPRYGIVTGVISILTYAIFALAFSQKWLVPLVIEDPAALGTWLSEGGSFLLMAVILVLTLWSSNQSWLEALESASAANQQMRIQTRELEETNERLRRQTSQLLTTAEIAKAGSSILDPERLLTEVVNQIQDGFSPMGVYYVGLFLLDTTRRFVVLKAATGEAGQLALEMGYKLELDETSAVGWCIVHRQARITLSGEETRFFGKNLVSHTRSEIALPLRSRTHILGALSVQSTHEAAFSETDVAALQTMADQVAVAIDNARLFSQTEAALEEVQAIQQRYLAQTWKDFLITRPVIQVDYTQPGIELGNGSLLHRARREAMVHGQTVTVEAVPPDQDESAASPQTPATGSGQAALVVPLKLREQVIGTMTLHETSHQRPWMPEEIDMAETIAEQVVLTVENLRLMDETQRRVARERLVGEISDRMQQAMDMEDLMRITAEELNMALGGSRTFVQMGTAAELVGGDGSGHKSEEER